MDKDRIEGSANQAQGKVKETVGKLTGDAKLQAEGNSEKVAGKVQNLVGGIKDTIKDAAKSDIWLGDKSSAPAPTDVRCCSNSGQIRVRRNCPLTAISGHFDPSSASVSFSFKIQFCDVRDACGHRQSGQPLQLIGLLLVSWTNNWFPWPAVST
jgi:uncharacterized protein YjbJ (UPF0337 family)